MGKCLVVGAGDCPGITIKRQDDDYLIAADAGLLTCLGQDLVPDLCVGDYDSMQFTEDHRAFLAEHGTALEILPSEKDDTDLMAALRQGLGKGYTEFVIYGALGGKRISHSVANLQILSFLQQNGARGCLIQEPGDKEEAYIRVTLLPAGSNRITGVKGEFVSLFAFGGNAVGVTIRGLYYELTDAVITPAFPIGVSNEFLDGEAVIEIGEGNLLMITERFACTDP